MNSQNYSIGVGYHESYILVHSYDRKKQQRIDSNDFENLILPTTKPFFRNQIKQSSQRLFPETLKNFAHLVLLELELARKLEQQKRYLTKRQDFNLLAAYKTISSKVPDGIDRNAIGEFLKQQGESLQTEDLEAIMRRLDRDKDRVINYTEFVNEFMPCQSHEDTHGGDARTLLGRLSPERSSPLRVSSLANRQTSPFMLKHINKTDVAPSTFVGVPKNFKDPSSISQESPLKFNSQSSPNLQASLKSKASSPTRLPIPKRFLEAATPSPLRARASSPLRTRGLGSPDSKLSEIKAKPPSPPRVHFPTRLNESITPKNITKQEDSPFRLSLLESPISKLDSPDKSILKNPI